jgi:hypothetical protein
MNESALQLWRGVLFRQRADLTFESISPHVQEWTGLEPQGALEAVLEADRPKVKADQATFRLRHARTWQITWVAQRRRAVSGGYEGYWENITERVHLGQELAQAHWQATLSIATQRLVHDFNNLLTGILSLSDAYLLRVRADNPAREGLQLINQNARQAADIVQQVGALFRERPGRRSYQNLSALAAAAGDMLRRVLPKHSSLKLEQRQESIPVYVDAAELKQVIVSLGLTLAPPIMIEAALQQKQATLKISGMASESSRAVLLAERFGDRNEASFDREGNSYSFRFAETDFSEAERQPPSILLLANESDEAFRVAELLRGHAYGVVIGSEALMRSPDYRFDLIAELGDGDSTLSQNADVFLSVRMTEEAMLATVREALKS